MKPRVWKKELHEQRTINNKNFISNGNFQINYSPQLSWENGSLTQIFGCGIVGGNIFKVYV